MFKKLSVRRCVKIFAIVTTSFLTGCVDQMTMTSDVIPFENGASDQGFYDQEKINRLSDFLARGASRGLTFSLDLDNRGLETTVVSYLNRMPGAQIVLSGGAWYEVEVVHDYERIRGNLYEIRTTVRIIDQDSINRRKLLAAISESSLKCQKVNTQYASPMHCREAEERTLTLALASLSPI